MLKGLEKQRLVEIFYSNFSGTGVLDMRARAIYTHL